MSLLAEPRRKQVISVNPQGKNVLAEWQEFGKNLMGRFGWKDGDGLGADRQGATDLLQMNIKNNSRGLGCSIEYEQNWLAHGEDFNSLLSSLNQTYAATSKQSTQKDDAAPVVDKVGSVSLEAKSKASRGRVHYHKFTRGKDLSTRSTEDISSILGGIPGRRKRDPSINADDSNAEIKVERDFEDTAVTGLQTVTSADNIHDYFIKKMARLKNKTESRTTDGGEDKHDGYRVAEIAKVEADGEVVEELEIRRKRKKRKPEDCVPSEGHADVLPSVSTVWEDVPVAVEKFYPLSANAVPDDAVGDVGFFDASIEDIDWRRKGTKKRRRNQRVSEDATTEPEKIARSVKEEQCAPVIPADESAGALAEPKKRRKRQHVENQAGSEPVSWLTSGSVESGMCAPENVEVETVASETRKKSKKQRKKNAEVSPSSTSTVSLVKLESPALDGPASVLDEKIVIRQEVTTTTTSPVGRSEEMVTEKTTAQTVTFRPGFTITMKSLRTHFQSLSDEARVKVFPGSNVFDVAGYGDELFH